MEPKKALKALIIFTDGSSNNIGVGDDPILNNDKGIIMKIPLHFKIYITNNLEKYEVYFVDLTLSSKMIVEEVKLHIYIRNTWFPKLRGIISKRSIATKVHNYG